MIRFLPDYAGELMGLPTDENHLNYKWNRPDCKILFSASRKGNAMSCHLASDKRGLRKLRIAFSEFIDFIFSNFKWCTMILAKIIPNSLKRFSEKVGFTYLISTPEYDVYYLPKEVYYEFNN